MRSDMQLTLLLQAVLCVLSIHCLQDGGDSDDMTYSLAFFPAMGPGETHTYLDNFLYVSSSEAGSCTISYNDGKRRTSKVDLIPGQIIEKALPEDTQISGQGIRLEPKAVYVSCDVEITLHGFNKQHGGAGTEAFLVLPDTLLANKYIVAGNNKMSYIGIVSLEADTHVSINISTPSYCNQNYSYQGRAHGNGDVMEVVLQHGEVFQLGSTAHSPMDHCTFDGSVIESNEKISVFLGSVWYFPNTGHINMQVLPTSYFSKTAIVPGAGRQGAGIDLRIIAEHDGTQVNITTEGNGQIQQTFKVLNRLEHFAEKYSVGVTYIVQSSEPVMVSHRTMYGPYGGSLMNVPGIEFYDRSFLVREFDTTPISSSHPYVTVVTSSGATGDVRMDGVPPANVTWQTLSTLPYSVGVFPLDSKGTHKISSSSPMLVRVDDHVPNSREPYSYIAGMKNPPTTPDMLKSAVTLRCLEAGWSLTVDAHKLHLKTSDASHLYLTTPNCAGVLHGHQLVFDYAYGECNTKSKILEKSVVYTNSLTYAPTSSENLIRNILWYYDLKCSLPVNGSDSLHIYPENTHSALGEISGVISQSSVHVALFKDMDFRHPVPGSAIHVGVGETMYVQVMTRNQMAVMVIRSCNAHVADNSLVNVPLIQDGCAIDARTKVIESRNQVTRFKFEVFDIPNETDGIYVTCHVTYCDPMDFSDKCKLGCKTSPHGSLIGK